MCRVLDCTQLARRRLLTVGGTTVLGLMPGCTRLFNAVGDRIFEDVNILNQLGREVSGSVKVIGPTDEVALDRAFDVPSTETGGESNTITYADVWTDPGTYQINIELADVELEGVSQASKAININDVEAEMVAVSIGSGNEDEPIAILVGESFSEFGQAATTE